MNKKLLYVLILVFLTAVVIFNIFLKKQPASFRTGMITSGVTSGVLS